MRLLHAMLRVGNLQRSIDFYTKTLEMRLLRTSENSEYKYTLAFVGYSDESEGGVDNATAACERIRQAGGKVTREAGRVKASAINHVSTAGTPGFTAHSSRPGCITRHARYTKICHNGG